MHLCDNCRVFSQATKVPNKDLCDNCRMQEGLDDQTAPDDLLYNMTMLYGSSIAGGLMLQQQEKQQA